MCKCRPICVESGKHIIYQHFEDVRAVRLVQERIFFTETDHFADRLRRLGIFGAGVFQLVGQLVYALGVFVHSQHPVLKILTNKLVDGNAETFGQLHECGVGRFRIVNNYGLCVFAV